MINNNFNGGKLTNIRLYRNKTIEQLSKATSIFKDTLVKYENNELTPKVEDILSLSNVLDVDRSFFYNDSEVNIDSIYVENKGLLNTGKYQSLIEKSKLTYLIYGYLKNYLMYPKVNIVDIYNNSDVDNMVNTIRKYYDLGNEPIINMLSFLESIGIVIAPFSDGKEKITAFTVVIEDEGKKYLSILGKDSKALCKRNYDLAIQFGYIIFKDKIDKDEFARKLLLPKDEFIKSFNEINEIEDFINLKMKWLVPTNILIKRSYELGLISNKKYNYLMDEYNNKKLKDKDLLDDIIKASSPSLLKRGINILMENNIMSKDSVVTSLNKSGINLYHSDIEELIGFKKDKLKPKNQNKSCKVLNLN